MTIPESLATTTAREVLVTTVFKAAQAVIEDLRASEQIDVNDALHLTQEVTKALATIPPEVGEHEVLKALPYGAAGTDADLLVQGAALSDEPVLSEYGQRRLAKALWDDTVAGLSPVSKAMGYEVPDDLEEFRVEVGDCFMQEFGVGAGDALACTAEFMRLAAGE